jgi:PKD repeat protein
MIEIPTYLRRILTATLFAVCLYQPTAMAERHPPAAHWLPIKTPNYISQQQDAPAKQGKGKPAITEGNSVNVRPSIGSAKRGVPVEVVVSKTRVGVLDRIRFTLVPKNRVANQRFTVNFGDGNEIQTTRTQLEHQYERAGHYDVLAWVTPDRGSAADTNSIPQPVPRVSLSATPTEVNPGRAVTFGAQLSIPYPNIKYRFGFGDSELTAWQDSAQTERPYNSLGSYLAYVDIGVETGGAVKQIGRSARVTIQVTRTALRTVDLTVEPNPAEAGSSVTLAALVVPQGPSIVYRFSFGDGSATSGWQESPQATHTYSSARTYPASVEIGTTVSGSIKPIGSAREAVRATPKSSPSTAVEFSVNPNPMQVGKPVTFIARSQDPNVKYRFVFGDGSRSSGWQRSPQVTRNYPVAGNYSAYVEIGRMNRGRLTTIATSRAIPVSVTSGPPPTPSPTPRHSQSSFSTSVVSPAGSTTASPSQGHGTWGLWGLRFASSDWWKYLLIALLVAGAAYWGWPLLMPPAPSFRARPDPGAADINGGAQSLGIESQMILNRDVSEGQYLVYTDEPSIVRSVRRDNG